ncbi:energy transducer TonB [Sphingobium yanoikuyae]|uniref:energy transducer TonB n=1 Tax=Sphingobium yanoikuyae TaxID=13690 RepID=UPI0035AFCC5C
MNKLLGIGVALLGIAGPVAAREPTGPEPKTSPGSWIKDSDYPTDERFKGVSGATEFQLLVDVDGGVKDCHVDASSGSAVLDATACALLKARASFLPARDGSGRTIESIYRNRVSWRIPEGAVMPLPTPQSFTLIVDMDKDGVVEKCTVEKNADFPLPADPCMRYPVGRKGAAYMSKDGTPIATRLFNRVSMEVQPR